MATFLDQANWSNDPEVIQETKVSAVAFCGEKSFDVNSYGKNKISQIKHIKKRNRADNKRRKNKTQPKKRLNTKPTHKQANRDMHALNGNVRYDIPVLFASYYLRRVPPSYIQSIELHRVAFGEYVFLNVALGHESQMAALHNHLMHSINGNIEESLKKRTEIAFDYAASANIEIIAVCKSSGERLDCKLCGGIDHLRSECPYRIMYHYIRFLCTRDFGMFIKSSPEVLIQNYCRELCYIPLCHPGRHPSGIQNEPIPGYIPSRDVLSMFDMHYAHKYQPELYAKFCQQFPIFKSEKKQEKDKEKEEAPDKTPVSDEALATEVAPPQPPPETKLNVEEFQLPNTKINVKRNSIPPVIPVKEGVKGPSNDSKEKIKPRPVLEGKVITDSECVYAIQEILLGDPREYDRNLQIVHVSPEDNRLIFSRATEKLDADFHIEVIRYTGIKQIWHTLFLARFLLAMRMHGTYYGLLSLAWVLLRYYTVVWALALITTYWLFSPIWWSFTSVISHIALYQIVKYISKSPLIWEKQTIVYIPHILSCVLHGTCDSLEDSVIGQRILRCGSINVPDRYGHEWFAGTLQIAKACSQLPKLFPRRPGSLQESGGPLYTFTPVSASGRYYAPVSTSHVNTLRDLSKRCFDEELFHQLVGNGMPTDTDTEKSNCPSLPLQNATASGLLEKTGRVLKTSGVYLRSGFQAMRLSQATGTMRRRLNKDSTNVSVESLRSCTASPAVLREISNRTLGRKQRRCPKLKFTASKNLSTNCDSQKAASSSIETPMLPPITADLAPVCPTT